MKEHLKDLREEAKVFIRSAPNMNVVDRNFFEKVMMLPEMYDMDKAGIRLDYNHLFELREKIRKESQEIRQEANWGTEK